MLIRNNTQVKIRQNCNKSDSRGLYFVLFTLEFWNEQNIVILLTFQNLFQLSKACYACIELIWVIVVALLCQRDAHFNELL